MMSEKAKNRTKLSKKKKVFTQNKFDDVETPSAKLHKVVDVVAGNRDRKRCWTCLRVKLFGW